MTIYLLDTNHCSRLIENDPDVLRAVIALPAADELVTTITVRGELFFMVEASARHAANLVRVQALLARLRLLDLDPPTDAQYGRLKAQLFAHFGPKGRRRADLQLADLGVSENDAWIAAAALRHGAVVVSADDDFVRIRTAVPDLVVTRWWTPQATP